MIHHGRRAFSLATLTIPLVIAASTLNAQDSSQTKPLSTAQQVLDRYVTAIGGHDVIYKHESMTIRGTFDLSEKGPSLDRVAYYKGGEFLYQINVPNKSPYQEAYNGKVAWQISPDGAATVSDGDEVKAKARDADMYYPAHVMDYFSSMEVVDAVDFEGHTCYHLKGINKWGRINEQFYDTTTGLLIGYRFNSTWRGGAGDESEVFSDYNDFGGWLMPTRKVSKSKDAMQVETITSVTFDDVDDSVFALPASVKSLLAKKSKS